MELIWLGCRPANLSTPGLHTIYDTADEQAMTRSDETFLNSHGFIPWCLERDCPKNGGGITSKYRDQERKTGRISIFHVTGTLIRDNM